MTWHYERLDGGNVVFLIQVLAGKRLIANFPEVNTAHRCVRRTSDRPSDCWCRAAWGYFQTSFITSFQHQLQNGGRKIDGWRGLVNMHDWNDTQTVLFVVVRVMAHILKRHALRFTGSTFIPIKQILTCKHFCRCESFFFNDYKCAYRNKATFVLFAFFCTSMLWLLLSIYSWFGVFLVSFCAPGNHFFIFCFLLLWEDLVQQQKVVKKKKTS